ncbi:restriction endonuclease subunit S [Allomeiothermus silvanus]|uniref:restriction endonuclease subunit S n=1 Tax=Allomeiothermus silvanus TaxID=52022 RepID=UPI0030B8223F
MSSPMTEVPKPETRPKLPEGWRWVRLRDICQQDRKVIANIDQRIGKPYLSLEHIESGTGEIRKTPQGKTEDEGKSATFAFDERHVLYGKLRPYLNKVALPSFAGRCTTEIVPLLPSEEVDRGFLAWLLRRPETVHYAMQGKTGSRMPRADMNHLLSALVPLPPLETQRRIATILTEQMGAVEKARKAAEEGLEAARKLPEAYLRSVFPTVPITVNTAPAPKGWRWTLLTDFARLESGHTPSRRREEWWGGDIPWISLSDIRALDGKTAIQTREYTNPEGIANSSARVLPAGTVVLSRTASVGFVTVIGRPMATSQDFVNWVCGPELEPWYLAYALIASREYIRSLGSGAVHQTVYVPVVQRFRLLHPDLETQHRIVAELNAKLEATQALIRSLEAQLEAIRALPAAILRRAFSGEL